MKKRFLFGLIASLLTICSCSNGSSAKTIDFNNVEDNGYVNNQVTGELSSFNLLSPFNGAVLDEIPTFSWENSTNARAYNLEICESEKFISDVDTIVYYVAKNIQTTSFTIQADLTTKNITYYWRVTATNSTGKKECNEVFSFYYKAAEVDEVELPIGEADDWMLHNLGSKANISIDNSNFFGNNKESLVVTFKKEDTNQGIVESDGWIIVTKTVEKNCYGTNGLFFNLYYSGDDASILIRLVDRDNEYWYCPIQISNNAKQSIILKFDSFIQRTKDVTVSNQKFDYERIKYMEVVFEKSFGDGVCLLSNVKAIKYQNYSNYFIDVLHFDSFVDADWVTEGYSFNRVINGDELGLNYNGMSGYGFAKLVTNRYFSNGDSIKVSIKYDGPTGTNVILRVYEEDTDRWSYKIPYSSLTNEYQTFVIPFNAFAKSDLYGDGKRQFYYVINIQFGLEGMNGTGTTFFKDFTIVNSEDYASETRRTVGDNGVIENFDQYKSTADLYFLWKESVNNKDEYMSLNNSAKVGGESNKYCGQFEYKSDMEAAGYLLPVNVSSDYTFNALSIWLKDASHKSTEAKYNHITDCSANTFVYVKLTSGEQYAYEFKTLSSFWHEYTIPYSSFELMNAEDIGGSPNPITNGGIESIGFSFRYIYLDINGNPSPAYSNSNVVYVDNISLTNGSEFKATVKEKVVSLNGKTAMIENAEAYETDSKLLYYWNYGNSQSYNNISLSNEVSSEGGNHSIKMAYKQKSSSVSYYTNPAIVSDVIAKGVRLSLKGDDHVTVYINLYVAISSSVIQYRATLYNVSSTWTEYSIGFSNFQNISGSQRTLGSKDVPNITKISFGATYNSATTDDMSEFYLDNFMFDTTLSFSTNETRVIE